MNISFFVRENGGPVDWSRGHTGMEAALTSAKAAVSQTGARYTIYKRTSEGEVEVVAIVG